MGAVGRSNGGSMDFVSAGAEFSDDRRYRFRLWRRWNVGRVLMVIGLNPSTADARILDPTVTRCVGYAQRWGFGALEMFNLVPFKATPPEAMSRWLREHQQTSEYVAMTT